MFNRFSLFGTSYDGTRASEFQIHPICSILVFFLIFVLGLTMSVNSEELYNEFRSLTEEQLAELDEFLSQKLDDASLLSSSSSQVVHRNTRRPRQRALVKRDVLWTTTEVLDCVRRLKLYKNSSKLDLTTELLNCYRRLKHRG